MSDQLKGNEIGRARRKAQAIKAAEVFEFCSHTKSRWQQQQQQVSQLIKMTFFFSSRV
jgi:hypothetical protein